MKKIKSLIDRGKLWVQSDGRIYRIDLNPTQAASANESGDGSGELVAPFNCKIVKVHVASGATVKKGDPIVSVEAMKMEYTYTSPRDGVIAEIRVKEAQVVTEGTTFVGWK